MKKLAFLSIWVLILSCTPDHQENNEEQGQPPNILFILTDDLGWGDLGRFYQNQRAAADGNHLPFQLTPHLDEMAAQGVMLTDHYANASVCAPSRASFLLGMHQGHSNVRDNQFDKALEDNYTVGNVLQMSGYHTVAVGKWGLQGDPRWDADGADWPGHPLNRGFDEFYGYIRHRDGHEHYPVEGVYRGEKEVYHNHENVAAGLAKSFTGDLWTAFAKQWIIDHQKTKQNQPFFMFLAYDTPHAVIELPTQAYPEGSGLDGGLQWLGEPGHMINTASGEVDSWVHPDYADATWDDDSNPSTPEVAWPDTYKRFATVNRRIDDAIGDIRQLLQDLGLEDNTMVVFTSDNGPSQESYLPEEYAKFTPEFFRSYGPFDGIKRDLWEGGVRVPAIVTWPDRLPKGNVSAQPVMMSDWLATFADAAGKEVPARTDGESMLDFLQGKEYTDQRSVYIEYNQNGRTPDYVHFLPNHTGRKRGQMQLIRMDDLVGVRYDIQNAQTDFEIYNVVKDPQQGTNLATQSQYQDLQQKMKDRVLQMRMPDTSAVRPYDNEYIPAVEQDQKRLTPGLTASSYETSSAWIPRTDGLNPTGTKTLSSAVIPDNMEGDLVVLSGYIEIPGNNDYLLQTSSGNQVLIRVHQALVIDGDYSADDEATYSGKIRLEAGLHPLKIYVKRQEASTWDFDLSIRDGSDAVIAPKYFTSSE